MISAIMQPTYIPWIGYFDLIEQVDNFIFLDDVQLEKSSWQLRNRIKFQDRECFLTINRKKNKSLPSLDSINKVHISDNENWRYKHIKTIEIAYRKSKFFDNIFPFIEQLINYETNKLSDFTIKIILSIVQKLEIKTNFFISSDIKLKNIDKINRIMDICKYVNTELYISPKGSFDYLKLDFSLEKFREENIDIKFQNYSHPTYTQLGKVFLPYISIIDLLFNYGFDDSLDIIKKGRNKLFSSNELN